MKNKILLTVLVVGAVGFLKPSDKVPSISDLKATFGSYQITQDSLVMNGSYVDGYDSETVSMASSLDAVTMNAFCRGLAKPKDLAANSTFWLGVVHALRELLASNEIKIGTPFYTATTDTIAIASDLSRGVHGRGEGVSIQLAADQFITYVGKCSPGREREVIDFLENKKSNLVIRGKVITFLDAYHKAREAGTNTVSSSKGADALEESLEGLIKCFSDYVFGQIHASFAL